MSHNNWGGERVGAGRPVEQKTLQAQKMRERLIELCSEWSGPRTLDTLPQEEGKYLPYGKAR